MTDKCQGGNESREKGRGVQNGSVAILNNQRQCHRGGMMCIGKDRAVKRESVSGQNGASTVFLLGRTRQTSYMRWTWVGL